MSAVDIPLDLIGLSGLYNVPDPLLRRLRLQDTVGNDILDVERYFQKKEVLILYAGSDHGLINLKELHRNLTTFSVREMKTCSVIYVSTDTDPSAPSRVLSGQAWLRMVFQDNSDFAPMVPVSEGDGKAKSHEAAVEEVKRGEEFVQAGEIETSMETVEFGVEERQNDYVRPLSRAAVTALMKAYSTPSIAIYHLPTHTFLSRNVRPAAFAPDQIDKNYDTWRNGGTPRVRLVDVLAKLRIPVIVLLVALGLRLYSLYGPDLLDEIPRQFEAWKAEWRRREAIKLP